MSSTNLKAFIRSAPPTVVAAFFLILPAFAFQLYGFVTAFALTVWKVHPTPVQIKGAVLLFLLWSAGLALGAFVLHALYRRQKFARVFVLVAFVFWSAMNLLLEHKTRAPLLDSIYFAFGAATALLFIARSSAWFNAE